MTPVNTPLVYRRSLAALTGAAVMAVLLGCSSQPPAPDWALNAESAAGRATQAYLEGQQRVETLEWAKARAEVARTGQGATMARLALMRCAAQVASLAWDDCPGYQAVALDAAAPEQAYAAYLQAKLDPAQVNRLPAPQQAVARQAGLAPVGDYAAIADPLSRLVALGVAMRYSGGRAELAALAVETASAQGWRRPLLAWLLWQQRQLQAQGDTQGAAVVQRRIDLVQSGGAQTLP